MSIGEKNHRGKLPFHHFMSRVRTLYVLLRLIPVHTDRDPWGGVIRLCHCEVTVPLNFHTVLCKELPTSNSHIKSRDLCSPPWVKGIYINYLEFCTADLSIFPHFLKFSYLFVPIWTHGYLVYTSGDNPILLYLFCWSNCSRPWEFFQLAPESLWKTPSM